MLARDRRRRHRRAVRRHPGGQAARRSCPTCRAPRPRSRSSACSAAWRRKNVAAGSVPFFVGAGAYQHHVPASVDHLIQRSEFLTSYTPYQPEIAQGTLQYLFEFQTQVAMLTGMEVANASMYDGSTARRRSGADGAPRHQAARRRCSPAACIRTTSRRRDRLAASPATSWWRRHPHGAAEDLTDKIDDDVSCVVVQTPDVFGQLRDLAAARREGACGRRAAGRRRHRGGVARPGRAAGRDGRRHRRGRGPVDRQRAELRRALCRPVRDAAEIRPPDAGPALPARPSTPRASAASC